MSNVKAMRFTHDTFENYGRDWLSRMAEARALAVDDEDAAWAEIDKLIDELGEVIEAGKEEFER